MNVTVELEIILSVFEIPTRATRALSRRMRTNVLSSCAVPNVQSNKQNDDSVLSKIIKS